MRTIFVIVILLVSSFAFGQNSTLIKNRNYRAAELKHNLNTSGDSLILQCLRSIIKVGISNDDFSRTFPVADKNISIPLTDIPIGRFTIEVQLENKLIIITLLRHDTIYATSKPLARLSEPSTEQTNLPILNKENNITSSKSDFSETSEVDLNKNEGRKVLNYWIVNFINKGQSSRKLMKIADLETVKRFIRKHEIDHRTKSGRYNELTIWEVYDTSKFMKYKRLNPDYANAESAESFNTKPFYQLLSEKESK